MLSPIETSRLLRKLEPLLTEIRAAPIEAGEELAETALAFAPVLGIERTEYASIAEALEACADKIRAAGR